MRNRVELRIAAVVRTATLLILLLWGASQGPIPQAESAPPTNKISPGTNTALGIPAQAQDNARQAGDPAGQQSSYKPPLRDPLQLPGQPPVPASQQKGGNYYLMADVDLSQSYTWHSVAGLPPGADPMQGSCNLTQIPRLPKPSGQPQPPGDWCMLRGTAPGWVKIEVRHAVTQQPVTHAFYRLYEIVTLEDEEGGKLGYDPRFGGAEPQWLPEEGGYHFSTHGAEPAAESILNYDDSWPPLGLTPEELEAWTGNPEIESWTGMSATPPRLLPHWTPESQLLPSPTMNSLVATTRDEQYVRVWLHGPVHQDLPIPVHLVCTSTYGGHGEVKPGVSQPNKSYQITVHWFRPPHSGQHPGGGNWVESGECPVVTRPKLHVKRHSLNDPPQSDPRRRQWILRIPWQGHTDQSGTRKVSHSYADIEVEARIPVYDGNGNYAGKAFDYGHDPDKILEGIMQLRWGTVIELQETEVRTGVPGMLSRLKDNWFRQYKYTLHNDNQVADPDMVTLGFGARVAWGDTSARDGDTRRIEIASSPLANDYLSKYSNAYLQETMLSAVNAQINTVPPVEWEHSFWVAGQWPKDADTPWMTSTNPDARPDSIQFDFRGYAGAISQTGYKDDFTLEPQEPNAGSSSDPKTCTHRVDVHFMNAVADVNNNGILDVGDDDESEEEGENGGKGLMINAVSDLSDYDLPDPDPNLREIRITCSRAATNYAGYEVRLSLDTTALGHARFWADNKRKNELLPEPGGFWKLPPTETGEPQSIYLGTDRATGDDIIQITVVALEDAGGSEPTARPQVLDEIKVTFGQLSIDVDSNRDGTVSIGIDDPVEELIPGAILMDAAGPAYENSANEAKLLVLQKFEHLGEFANPTVRLVKEGSGNVRIYSNATGDHAGIFLDENDQSQILDQSVRSLASGPLVYSMRAWGPGDVRIVLRIEDGNNIVMLDWVQVSVLQGDLIIHDGLPQWGGGSALEEKAGLRNEYTVGAVTVANMNDTDNNGNPDYDDNSVSGEQDLMRLIVEEPAHPAGAVTAYRLRVLQGSNDVKFWKGQSKSPGLASTTFSPTSFTSDANSNDVDDVVMYVEATAQTPTIRGISIAYEGRLAGEDEEWIEFDRVRATAIWTQISQTWTNSSSALPDTMENTKLRTDCLNLRGTLDGTDRDGPIWHIGPCSGLFLQGAQEWTNTRTGARILMEFRVLPIGADSLGVTWDISRQIEAKDRVVDSGKHNWTADPADEAWPSHNEQPNDDGTFREEDGEPPDEDNSPNSGLIYSMDSPITPITRPKSKPWAFFVRQLNFREFVRVRLGTSTFDNTKETIQGVRASDHFEWYVLDYLRRNSDERWEHDTSGTKAAASFPRQTGSGNASMEVTLLDDTMASEGFKVKYASSGTEWTLTGTKTTTGDTESGSDGPWTLEIPNKVKVVITKNAGASLANNDEFTFTVFKSARSGGKKSELIPDASTTVLDTP